MADSKIRSMLDAAGIRYKDQGRWALGVIGHPGGRSHAFNIDFEGDEWHGYREHDIRMCIGPVGDGSVLKKLCEAAANLRRGSIVVKGDDVWLKWEVPSTVSGEVLITQLFAATAVADRLEQEHFEEDKE
jgi:hypothetical protein